MAQIERIEIPVPFEPGSMNCYFIPDSTPTLIDTGINTPDALQSLEAGLRKSGARVSDIRRIILTHGHADHAGLAGAVAAISKASVFVHYGDKRRTLSGSAGASRENEVLFRGFFEEAGVPGDITHKSVAAILDRLCKHLSPLSDVELLKGGELFSFDLFNLSVLHTPGHTPGSICLFDKTNGVLFSGDCLIQGVIPYITIPLKDPGDLTRYCGLEQYERSLEDDGRTSRWNGSARPRSALFRPPGADRTDKARAGKTAAGNPPDIERQEEWKIGDSWHEPVRSHHIPVSLRLERQ